MKTKMKIIGFTGMPGSGKTEAVRVAKELGSKVKVKVFSMGDIVKDEARKRGVEINDENVGRFATGERENFGKGIWAERTAERIKNISDGIIVVIDGIRNNEEIEKFREIFDKDFITIAIHTRTKERFERMMEREREDDIKSKEEFDKRDERELGWGIGTTIARADITVVNEGTLESFKQKIREILLQITS